MIKLKDFEHDTGHRLTYRIKLFCPAYCKKNQSMVPDLSKIKVTKDKCVIQSWWADRFGDYAKIMTVKEALAWCEKRNLVPVNATINGDRVSCYITLGVRSLIKEN